MLTRDRLHDYQHHCVEFIKQTPYCALWLDLGLGKTVTTLTAMADMMMDFEVNKCLIIAPLRVANTTWHKELGSWEHTAGLRYQICTGSEKKRAESLSKPADIYIINRENVEWLVNFYGKKWPFDAVVVDESSSFKSSKSRRFKSLKKMRPFINHMIQLTGTPAPQGLLDLWPQVFLLDGGARLGKSMTAYKQRYFYSDYMGYTFTPKEHAKQEIYDAISDVVITMQASDYIDVPERVDVVELVTMQKSLMNKYKKFEREFVTALHDNEVTAVNAAVLANKLLQFANGAMYVEDPDSGRRYETIHDEKINALAALVEDNPNENLLIAYNYEFDLKKIQEKFPDAVVLSKSGDEVEQWNAGKIKMLLAHPASAGHGLNLQRGGSVIVWYGLNWSLELYQQFNGRLHRQGQQHSVRVVHIVTEGTIDHAVMQAIKSKASNQNELIQALKANL